MAAAILVVFFVPLPHLGLFHRLVTPTKPTVPTASKQPPIGTQLAELGSEVGPHSQFSVGVSGSTAVVGLQVITKTAAGWKQTAELKNSDTYSNGCLGLSNAISGDTIVESDPCYANLTGRSYVFTKTTRGWEQTAVLNGSDSVPNDKFGYPVAISGTTIVVGAQNAGLDSAGRAYVFTKRTKGWKQVAELEGSDTVPNDQFGISVAISGTTIAVGASYHTGDAGRAYEAGSAYVFTKTTKGWKQVAELKGSDTVTFDNFGISVAISGTTIVVGAQNAGVDNAGRAYVFAKTASGWRQVAELKGSRVAVLFGYWVGISGETAVVGSPVTSSFPIPPRTSPGQAYLFSKKANGWARVAKLKGSSTRSDQFGFSVAISGTAAIVASPGPGRAYVFQA